MIVTFAGDSYVVIVVSGCSLPSCTTAAVICLPASVSPLQVRLIGKLNFRLPGTAMLLGASTSGVVHAAFVVNCQLNWNG